MYLKKRKLILFSAFFLGGMFVQSGGFAYISSENPQDPETALAGYVVNIPDVNLKSALNAILANVNGTTRTPTQNITAGELRAPNMAHFRDATTLAEKGITNLEGIQFLTQAQTIRLNNSNLNVPNRNIIANLEPLKDLKKLTELRLAFNNISNITPLGNITSLKELHLTSNSAISDISALSSLVNLEAIFMSHLPNTKTIEPLRPLTKLRNVQFSSNNVTDLSPIQGKTTIEYLYINTNKFTNFEVLSTLTNLKNLEISNTGIKDITVLAPLTQLQHLSLWFNDQIADFSTLARLIALKYLNIQKTNFKDSDIFHIASLPALNELRARENQLSDLSALAHYSFVANSTFNDQRKTLDTVYVPVIPNPIKNRDGSIVPVTETADVENVDAAGNPNPNRGYLKIKKTGQGTVTVNWKENPGTNSFSGILTIPYNINLTPPTLTLTTADNITPSNASNYTLAGTCSEIGKPVIIIIGNLSPMTINCEAGGTFSKTGIDVSSLAEGDVAIVASQTNASNVEGKVEVTVKKDQTGPTLQTPTATLNPETETITFTIPEVQDLSGVTKYIYSIQECDADRSNCSTVVGTTEIPFQAGNEIIEYPNPKKDKNRKYILKVQAEDTLGNKSPEQTSTLDTEVLEIAFQTGVHGTINPTTSQKVFNNAPFSKITFPTPTPNPGYQFKNWTDTNGNTPPSASTPIRLGTTYTANFELLNNNNAGGNNNGHNNGNSSSSSGFSGGGGGGAALIRDHCPQGDNSSSYYDNSCGTAQDSDQTQDQNSDRQSPAIPTDNEMIDAYKRAFENGITTQPSLADARLLDYLTRAELAKMLSIFTLKYTDRQPILDKPFCDTYTDADQVNAELSSYMTTACKLEIMGLHSDGKTPLDAFMPNKHVSRAELVTVLSRVLYGNTYDNNTANQRWQGHMDKLHTDAVIKDPTPTIQEIRAYVLLMMYRIKGK